VLMQAPPPAAPLECSDSHAAPIADRVGVIAVPLVSLAAWTFGCGGDEGYNGCYRDTWMVPTIGVAVGAVYLASSIYGYRRAARCRALKSH
jgi:hypothetical protein